jgi:cobalamin-dependent methionine synthase I
MKLTYDIHEITPYINWPYYYFAWQVKDPAEQDKLKADALKRLEQLEDKYHTYAVFRLLPANSEGDDILIWNVEESDNLLAMSESCLPTKNESNLPTKGGSNLQQEEAYRLPMLRQQAVSPSLCLADFIRPLSSGKKDTIGLFATSVSIGLETDFAYDDFLRMQTQLLSDRLAEATAEKMHQEVRTKYWGYAKDEHLTMDELHAEKFQGIRPAVGYPSMPDTSVNFLIDELLDMKQIGIRLTESGAMKPHASVSGLMIAHKQASYFLLGKIGEDQLNDYARRRGIPVEMMRKFIGASVK